MRTAQKGDKVKVHYHGKLTSGETFDSSKGREPLEFTVGAGMVIKGFDDALIEMKTGDVKTVNIPVAEAYGARVEEMFFDFPKANFPDDMTPQVGMQLNMRDSHGQQVPVVIVAIEEDSVKLDANHPLAGQDLIFEIELVDIAGKIIL